MYMYFPLSADFCKRIQEKTGQQAYSDDDEVRPTPGSDEEGGPFIHHPFKVRELPNNIVMNIRVSLNYQSQNPPTQEKLFSLLNCSGL